MSNVSLTTATPRFKFWSWALVCLYFVSGVTALSYEVLWARALSLQFGVSIFGVVVTVASFMAGLGLGSLLGLRLRKFVTRPLVLFSLLELLVAIFSFNMPTLFSTLDFTIAAVSSQLSLGSWYFVQILLTFCVMLVPATLLGLCFPLVLSFFSSSKFSVGLVYGANTLGGVFGAILPLFLLPIFGWTVSLRLVAILGIGVASIAMLIAYLSRSRVSLLESKAVTSLNRKFVLYYALLGAASLMLEIAWTRLFGMIFMRTEYVLGILLAAFLIGIAIGSFIAKFLRSNAWVTVLPILAAFCTIGILWLIPVVATVKDSLVGNSFSLTLFTQFLILFLLTAPVTIVFGAWLPLLAARTNQEHDAGSMLYGFNSLGAAGGALIAGFLITPYLGTHAAIIIAALMILFLGLHWSSHSRLRFLVIPLILFALPVTKFFSVSALTPSLDGSRDLYYDESAISLTHVTEDKTKNRLLLSDLQRMDASSEPTAVVVQKNQARLPLMLNPDAKNVLFLGLGTGITAAGSLALQDLNRVAVELSPGAIYASSHYFSDINGDIASHASIVQDDARRYLKRTRQLSDVIVGDLFHPDLVGRANLLSLQQFARVKEHLSSDGLFVQWLALNQFDVATLKVVLQTFRESFPVNELYLDGFRVAMVGYNGKIKPRDYLVSRFNALPGDVRAELSGGEGVWTWLGRSWGSIPDFNVKIQDEWAPIIEFNLPKVKFAGENNLEHILAFLLRQRPAVEDVVRGSNNPAVLNDSFEKAYIASEMLVSSWKASFSGSPEDAAKLLTLAYQANSLDRWIGFDLADKMMLSLEQGAAASGLNYREALSSVLAVRPDHLEALKALMDSSAQLGEAGEVAGLRSLISYLNPYYTTDM